MDGFVSEASEFGQRPTGPSTSDAFRCPFPGCNARYRHKEHLNRHERSKHLAQQVFICSECSRGFQRSDTLRRHLRKQHKTTELPTRASRACVGCHTGKTRCEGGMPCEECVRRKIQCSFQGHTSIEEEQRARSSTPPSPSLSHVQSPLFHWDKREQWIDCYFETFHPSWPFIHRGSFNMRHEPPLLLQSMTAIGMWTSREQSAQAAAVELHGRLDVAIRDQRNKWDASEVELACSACFWPIATYQAILLHVICTAVMSAGGVIPLDLKTPISAADFTLLKSLVASCRKLGMFYYPNMLASYTEADLPSFVWVGIEEVKRFNIALYKLSERLCSSTSENMPLLRVDELQFPLPINDPLWNSVERDEWDAHAKRENNFSLKDDCQTKWISRFADILQPLL